MKTYKKTHGLTSCSVVALLGYLASTTSLASAATLVVTSNGDTGPGTLRQAIVDANTNVGADAITFASPLFATVQTIQLGSALPYINDNLRITGPGANLLTVKESGMGGTLYILTVNSGVSANLSGLTLSNGNNGIANSGTVVVTNCTLNDNPGNGIATDGTATLTNCTISGNGDGVYGSGTMTLTNCTISGNGNGLYKDSGTANLINCTLSGNTNTGINNDGGTATLKNTLVAGDATNTIGIITDGGGNLIGGDPKLGPLQDNGGPTKTMALLSGSSAINAGNNSDAPATDQRGVARPQVKRVDIGAFELEFTPTESPVVTTTADEDNGTSDPTVGSGTSLREAIAYANSNADVSEITFKSGLTGTIQLGSSLTMNTSMNVTATATQNITVRGGGVGAFGIFIVNTGHTAQLLNLTLSNANFGVDNNGLLKMSHCTLSENGGGVLNNGTATLTNCTFSGNGNGLFNLETATLFNCTLSDNSTGVNNNGGTVTLKDTLCAGNTANSSGNITDGGNNITDGTAHEAGLETTDDLDTVVLRDNGGPTHTIALISSTGTAVNAGSNANIPNGITTDQRGQSRIQGGTVDVGAFESAFLPPPPTLNITAPVDNSTLPNAPTTATGTADNVTDVKMYSLYRYTTGGNSSGYWDGNTTTPVFTSTYRSSVNQKPATNTGTKFSTWSLDLPALIPGRYRLLMRGTNALGTRVHQFVLFTVNDGSPKVAITAPKSYSTFPSSGADSLIAATGTASDADGIASVTVRLYRKPVGGNSAGYWNGTTFESPYNPALHEMATTVAGTTNTTWRLNMPVMGGGAYQLVATAKDTLGNYKVSSVSFTVDDAPPTLNITAPVDNSTLPNAPTTATGTADNVTDVKMYSLYRYTTGGNSSGYWDGNTTTPVFTSTYRSSVNQKPATNTGTKFSTWSLDLPALIPGRYRLLMRGTNALGTRVHQFVLFTVNDGSPEVAITSPSSGSSITQGTPMTATGTASDADGIAGVTVRLYRKPVEGDIAGYWNGTTFEAPYNPARHEMAASSADGFATWSVDLPALDEGRYTLVATAKDTLGNYSSASKGATAKAMALSGAEASEGSVSFTVVAPPKAMASALINMTAIASSNTVALEFSGAAPQGAFSVSVNGQAVAISETVRATQSVTLLLPDNSLHEGDAVKVTWKGGTAQGIAE